ncbi:DivIVA domain-containing protein [Amycolatopsis solani]|uniref:DivIVA domain-containing protein n=1 Tax=Amycolatopsis solani TaxID=3028615 RepID=UPI0025AF82A5|nr:DivIVA domain-containing protein [Amycolatopsis sp. MEP2-6]
MAPGGGEDVARFDLAWRGFNRAQVKEYVDWAEAEIRRLTAERDAARRRGAELAEQNGELRVKIDRISRTPIAPDALQERSRRMIELTREEATEITAQATETAARIVREAEAEAVRLTAEERRLVAEAEAERDRHRAEHEELIRAAEQRRRDLDEAAAHRRAELEEDHKRAMTIRRAEAMRELAAQDEAARAKADQLVAEAAQRGEAMVGAAEREVAALNEVRDKLHASLTGCRTLLTEAAVALDDRPAPFDPEATLPMPMSKRVPVQRRSPADNLADPVS